MSYQRETFNILIVSDPQFRILLESHLPNDDSLKVDFTPFDDVSSGCPEGYQLFLFAIRPSQLKKSMELKHLWSVKSETAVIGDKLHAHEVVRLIKSGFSEVFDISTDMDLIREWVLAHYEDSIRSKQAQTGSIRKKPEDRIRGDSNAIQQVRDMAVQAAGYADMTVLIQGETGTGKEMVARLIHETSSRRQGPFIEVNCSAIPETLMEAEMLGYEKGAFTDARRAKKGFFELADNGTLFLDEIGVMPLSLQNKLLKVVEEKKFRRLGGETEITVDVKIVAGTNEDLDKAASEGRFRPDLYYRLKVFNILIPALRDRQHDIPVLADFFLDQVKSRYSLPISGFHPTTEKLLIQYRWPGNVRELKHVVERACVLAARGRILPNHLPEEVQAATLSRLQSDSMEIPSSSSLCIPLPDDGIAMDDIERHVMQEVLKRCNGNQSLTARYLKISRTRLIRKLSG